MCENIGSQKNNDKAGGKPKRTEAERRAKFSNRLKARDVICLTMRCGTKRGMGSESEEGLRPEDRS
jgi:hypothetical protein